MSKEPRDISGEFRKWYLNYIQGSNENDLNSDDLEIAFHAGYSVAIDEAIEKSRK